jgi:Na+-translocating ferredoxin:NAD+ oxidoreductase RnfA subunit
MEMENLMYLIFGMFITYLFTNIMILKGVLKNIDKGELNLYDKLVLVSQSLFFALPMLMFYLSIGGYDDRKIYK